MLAVLIITFCVSRFGDRQGMQRAILPSRLAIIAAGIKSDTFIDSWARDLKVPYQIIRDKHPNLHHDIGETVYWFRYIIDNYNHLADFSIFLDDTGFEAWHVSNKYKWSRAIQFHTPSSYEPLGLTLPDKNYKHVYFRDVNAGGVDEWDCAFQILRIFNVLYDPEKHGAVCCLNSIVPRKNVVRYPKQTYIDMYNMIKQNPIHTAFCQSGKWGYAFERIAQIIWG